VNIVVVSAFRDMVGRTDHYMAQIDALQRHAWKDSTAHTIRVAAITGDDIDGTETALMISASRYRIPISITRHDTNKPHYPSIEHTERLEALTGVMKAGMHAVRVGPLADVVLYIESDLLWDPHQVGSIIDMAYRREQGFDIIAPMIFCGTGAQFYDIFVYRKDGARFSPHPPYTHGMRLGAHEITEVDSVGSCLAFRAELALVVKPIGSECLISWCNGARAQGYRVGVAHGFRVNHP
jgi:hypothetical protein